MIKTAADEVSGPLRSWAERVRLTYALDNDPVGPDGEPALPRMDYAQKNHWAGAESAISCVNSVPYSLESETHKHATRLRLYIEDERTVEVLLRHIQERIVDNWTYFRDIVWQLYNGRIRNNIPTAEMIREMVVKGCREDWVYWTPPTPYYFSEVVASRNSSGSSSSI